MKKEELKTAKYIYNKLGLDEENIEQDMINNYLTINEGRNEKNYMWYFDENKEMAVEIATMKILTEEEIEKELY